MFERRVLEKLDYLQMTERLIELCLLKRGKEHAESLLPSSDWAEVNRRLQETDEAKELLRFNPQFSVRGAKEIRPLLERSGRGGMLIPGELLDIRDTLRAGRRVRQALSESKQDLPTLKGIVQTIEPLKQLEDEITTAITEDGEVADAASPKLAELRRSKNTLQQRIRATLEEFLRNPANQKMLQDPIVTQRGDRYVIPVKQEYRGAVPGIVHDQSASGATLFIEPMAVVRLGNELREVVLKEEREIERILLQLTDAVAAEDERIVSLFEALGYLDFVLGKALLSLEMNAGRPEILTRPQVRLVQARHPLIKGEVVPLTVEIGSKYSMIVITGPNTGGKTVTLKTIGLFVLMTQAGLHIPAESTSQIGIFNGVYADIGDEQSVEQSLSTFSGHMKNIISILRHADNRSLVLLDEVGAGTDPTEGAALAMAILSEFHERQALVVATTHYGALKTFAYNTPGVINASVEFDVETLQPTYRLLIGIPGKSNALNIARRLGLENKVLEKAQSFISERESQMEILLENLEDTQREIELEKRRIEAAKRETERQSQVIALKSLQLDEEYLEYRAKAKEEAAELIRQVKREAEAIIDELKAAMKKERQEQQAAIEKSRQRLRALSEGLDRIGGTAKDGGVKPEQIKLGMTVYLTELRQKGQVLKLPNDQGEILVQAGLAKVTVPLSKVRLTTQQGQTQAEPTRRGTSIGHTKAQILRSEIDLRGKLVDEAVYELDKYLDDAVLTGIDQVYVIHGKGTGALRAGIHDFLRRHPHVKGFRLGEYGEGDSGVTIVNLK